MTATDYISRMADSATTAHTAPKARRSTLHVLAQRNFALYFVGNLASNCGTWFQVIAQSLLVYRLTASTFLVGVTNFAMFIGVVLLAPWAGPAADRFDRRRLLIVTQIGATAVSASLAALIALGWGKVWVVVSMALLLGFTTAFATPAMQAIVPALVSREDIGAAVAMNSVTFNLSRAVGGVVGAFVVERLGIPLAVALNAASYLVFALVLTLLDVGRAGTKPTQSGNRPRLIDSIRLVLRDRALLVLLIAVAAASLTMDPVSTTAPEFASRIFHRPDVYAGYLLGAFGSGALVASVFPIGRPKRWLIASMFVVFGAGIFGFGVAPTLFIAYGALAVSGFGYLAGQTRATTLLQLDVNEHERGRVMALWSVAFLGSRPAASAIDGGLVALFGPRVATIILSVPAFAAAALLAITGMDRERE
jgi:MFS family permease